MNCMLEICDCGFGWAEVIFEIDMFDNYAVSRLITVRPYAVERSVVMAFGLGARSQVKFDLSARSCWSSALVLGLVGVRP
ncbi:hypothetical protein LR48_Vigan01g067700 [Vigna angularis]|uniref:Uncharacterized protein n=1 Tax=Phaseolus angularis TaxID=3914 RepID=A0A0L9TL13_PHAAN|nr:hypothetical protein LR48_Vigan01g067700 [Vigna angularis]